MAHSNAQRAETNEASESTGRRPVDTAKHGNVEIAIGATAAKGASSTAPPPRPSVIKTKRANGRTAAISAGMTFSIWPRPRAKPRP